MVGRVIFRFHSIENFYLYMGIHTCIKHLYTIYICNTINPLCDFFFAKNLTSFPIQSMIFDIFMDNVELTLSLCYRYIEDYYKSKQGIHHRDAWLT